MVLGERNSETGLEVGFVVFVLEFGSLWNWIH